MNQNIDIEQTRTNLSQMAAGLDELFAKLVEDHTEKGLEVLEGFSDFRRNMPTTFLERAKTRLHKKDYKIGFAGGFSAGKSTLINALLGMPDMLPTQAGECTMSITLVQNPMGGDQHVEAHYFTKESALRYIYTNARYNALLVKYKDDVLNNFSEEKAIKGIKAGAEMAGKVPEHKSKQQELDEFLHFLDIYSERLGTVWVDKIENADVYLTTDKDNRGLGHLLLIEQVHMFKNMALFNEKDCVIIDLPGTDSVNERQRQMSFQYLSQADAIVIVLGPRGLDANAQALWSELAQQFHEIKNKLFFVINMFDALPADQLAKAEIERVLKAQVIDQLLNFNLDPSKLYLTSGLRQELTIRKEKGTITPQQLTQLEGINKDCASKLAALDQDIIPDIREKIVKCLESDDGGVKYLRDELVRYLEYDIQVERLKEIFLDLEKSYEPVVGLLGPQQARFQQIAGNKASMGQEVTTFFEKTKETFMREIEMIPQLVEKVVPMIMQNMAGDLKKLVQDVIVKESFFRFTAKPNKRVKQIKEEIIEHMKDTLTDRFAAHVKEKVPAPIKGKLFENVEKTKVGVIISKLAEQLGEDWGTRFEKVLDDFNTGIDAFTFMRALEETWPLQDAEIEVPEDPSNRNWTTDIEKDFRKQMADLFIDQFAGLSQHLAPIIGRHYRFMIMGLVENFNKLIDGLYERVRADPMAVALPMALLVGDDDEKMKLDRALISYMEKWETIKEARTPVAKAFTKE